MSLAPTEEQQELRRVVRAFLSERSPEAEVRRSMAAGQGHDPAVWSLMAGQLGLPALAIPEEYGGAGFGYAELGIVLEELGRALTPGPYLATVALAAEALLRCADETAKKDLLPGIADGTLIATLATDASATATGGDEWSVSGTATFVVAGMAADLVLVVADTPDGPCLFAVDTASPAVRRTPLPVMDQTRRQARAEFAGAPARLIGAAGAALERALDTAAILLAAEQLGAARWALEMTVEQAKNRVQFGRPIGSFQAVKHRCAELLVDVEAARSAVAAGLRALDAESPDIPVLASLAQACCSELATRVTAENIQIHGGLGFTWEHPAHLYFKRAKSSEVLLGGPAHHRERFVQRMGF